MIIFYTDDSNIKDASLLATGILPSKNNKAHIPPGIKDFKYTQICPYECTENLPKEGINILNVFPHMHTIGKEIKISIIRNRKELLPINEVKY